jgi:hypothetical protein
MWDNSNIIIWQKDGSALYLYARWGEQLPQILQQALKKSQSWWNNDAVMNRIIFNEMLSSSPDGNNEFSLSTSASAQSNFSHNIHVDIAKQMVFIGSHDRKHWGETWHEGEHLEHEPDHWNFLTFIALNIPLTFPIHHQTHSSELRVETISEPDGSVLDDNIFVKNIEQNSPDSEQQSLNNILHLVACDSLIEHLMDDAIYTFLWNNQPVKDFIIHKHLLNEVIEGNDIDSNTAIVEFYTMNIDNDIHANVNVEDNRGVIKEKQKTSINLNELCDALKTDSGEWKINYPLGILKIIPEIMTTQV